MAVTASEILKVYNKWNDISKDKLIQNVESILYMEYECKGYTDFFKALQEITGVSKHTAIAWMNKGRNTKISFLRILELSEHFKVDIVKLLTAYECDDYEELYKLIKEGRA